MNGNTNLAANEIVGQPILEGIWLQTRPLPWYSTYVGVGSVLEFFLVITCAGFNRIFPGRQTEIENRLDHSGSIYCVRTQNEMVFIASLGRIGNCNLTHVLRRFPLSELTSFDVNLAAPPNVDIQLESGERFTFYYVGGLSELKRFGLSVGEKVSGAKPAI